MTKQEFYNNIDWQAPLCRDFFMKLYGYGLYDKEFLADVLSGFQSRGRGHVRHVYDIFVELEEIRQEGKTFPVECQFCDAVYSFTPEDIGKLLEKI